MGRTHALSGAAAYLAMATLVPVWPAGGGDLVIGTVVAAGAAILPDLDHPQSRIARAAGPLSWLVAVLVGRLGGGHRQVTHSVVGVAAMAGLTWVIAQAGELAVGLWAAFLAALAVGALGLWRRFGVLHLVVCLLAAAALILTATIDSPPGWSLVVAVGLGALTHVVGDMLTREGCPLLWPWRRRWALAAVRTDGWVERLVVGPLLALSVLVLAAWQGA